MKRWQWIFMAVAFLASAAYAANSVGWFTESGSGPCDLNRYPCCNVSISDSETNESEFLWVGGKTVTIQWEPDNTGSNTVATGRLYSCIHDDLNTCKEFKWDTDGDGLVDNSLFDFSSDMKQAIQGVEIAGFAYIDPITLPGSGDEAEAQFCTVQRYK